MARTLGSLLVCLLWPCLTHGQAPTKPRVSAIVGHTFDNDEGALSKDNVFADDFSGMWNQVQVDAVLVVVEVSGDPYSSYWRKLDRNYKVQLSGRGKKVWTQTRPILKLNESGKRYLSFLVYHDACTTLTVTAKVIGPGPNAPVEVSLPFNCGE